MKKISFLIIFIFLSINIFGQLPPIVGFDQMIYVYDNKIEVPLGEFDIVEPEPDPDPVTEYRRVYFVHGLGGDASAWIKVADAFQNSNLGLNTLGFPARKVKAHRFDYSQSTNASLHMAAQTIKGEIRNISYLDSTEDNMKPSQAFIIAHSQGGLVSRTLLHIDFVEDTNNRPVYGVGYGGLVTVASPLQGAMILNNRDMILDMAEDACVSLIAGPESSLRVIEGNVIENVINKIDKTNNGTGYICNVATQGVLPIFFTDYYASITNDYKVGASWIQTLNNDASNATYCNMPKVAFYGVEPVTNLFWRTVNWFTTNPNSVDYFAANDDFGFYNSVIKPEYNKYVRRTNDFQANADKAMRAYKCQIWWNPIGAMIALGIYGKNNNKWWAWNKGVRFFERANEEWQVIIGARRYHRLPLNPQEIEGFSYYPNDGVVLQESAADLPCATNKPVKLYNSSHMQIRNDENIKEAMRKLLDGEYGKFFQTDVQ